MEIKIQIGVGYDVERVIGTLVSEEDKLDIIIGEIISYDPMTGIAICSLYEMKEGDKNRPPKDIIYY